MLDTHLLQVIVRQSVDKAEFDDSSVEKITSLLFNHCESEEEGVRNVVAECLGKIALIEPGKLVPALKVSLQSVKPVYKHCIIILMHKIICSIHDYRRGHPILLLSPEQLL